MRADLLLAHNIRALLDSRHIDASALAIWCGHKPAWISKILNNERGAQLKDLNKMADFFGLTVAELFQFGVSPLTERRKRQRRLCAERRTKEDRRGQQRVDIHPDVPLRFPPRHDSDDP